MRLIRIRAGFVSGASIWRGQGQSGEPMDESSFMRAELRDHALTRPANGAAGAQRGRPQKAQQKHIFQTVEGAPNKANNERIDRPKAARQNISMLNKSALERAVNSVLQDNGITSEAKRETVLRAIVAKVEKAVVANQSPARVGRPNQARENYETLRQIDFASMETLTPEMLPVARRLVTAERSLRRSGVSDEVLGDRKQVKAASRLANAFQNAARKISL